MRTSLKSFCFLFVPIAGLGLMMAAQVTAQNFTTLHSFTAVVDSTNSDGATPYAGLILSGSTLYGTTYIGGTSSAGNGAVFAINTDGTGFTNLHSLNKSSDGGLPRAGLIVSGNTLYGTTTFGGPGVQGTVFAVNTDGSGFTNVHSFPTNNIITGHNSDGANPYGGLILSRNTLYGTANKGGDWGVGTVFAVSTDGTGFTNLHNFNGGDNGNSPYAGLILSGNTLYGTALTQSSGTVFAMNTDGTGFTNLHNFNTLDGALPYAGLILSGNTLYGATYNNGPVNGTVFAVNTDGTGFTNLHSFTPTIPATNSDGAHPYAGLLVSGHTLYGTTTAGGSSGKGTVFAVNTDGTAFTNLHSFTATTSGTNSDGATPYGGLVLSGHTLYGTTTAGGSSANGTVFSISLPQPQLTIVPSGGNVIVTWPTNANRFTLQSTANVVSPVWTTNTPVPVVVNGLITVTNPINGTQQFFRLSQ